LKTPKECANLYGPVPSRRLGFSLGIDFIPFKTCSLDCVYCQLGHVPEKTTFRKSYIPASEILPQIKKTIDSGVRIDYLTFYGSGESTLNSEIGKLIRNIKTITDIPIAVLTNGTLLQRSEVRKALLAADLVIPSLDAVTQDVFDRINRPHPSLRVEDIIAGIKKFRREFKGLMWIEVLLVKGFNDTLEHLNKLKTVLDDIQPDKIQLNTVIRPPAEAVARPLSKAEMERVKAFLGDRCEIIADFKKKTDDLTKKSSEDSILAILKRRPMTPSDLAASLSLHRDIVIKQLQILVERGEIRPVQHKGHVYYEPAE
jgi:wyosine [tRNA(Phe)-imidazoG37] synthetase (radical SAM superfamily)